MREKQPSATPTRAAARPKASAVKPSPRATTTSTATSKSPTTGRLTATTTPTRATSTPARSPPASREKPAPRSDPLRQARTSAKDAPSPQTARRAPTPSSRSPTPPPAPAAPRETTSPAVSATARMGGVNSEPRGGALRLSGASDLLLGEPPDSRPLRRTVSNISTDTEEVRRLRAQLQTVKEQVHFMHKMVQELSVPDRQKIQGAMPLDASKRLSFSGISPVKKTRGSVDVIVMPEDQNPFQGSWKLPPTSDRSASLFVDTPAPFARSVGSAVTEPSARERELASKLNALQLQNDSLKAQLQEQKQTFESTEAELKAQVEDCSAKLAIIDAENLQLHNHIEEFEEENLRLHAALAEMANERETSVGSNNQGDTTGGAAVQDTEDLDDELGIDGLGEEPDDIHARCDTKIHELWQTIKTLKAYVETFRVENEDLRVQRDNAISSAERAWEENVKLAGNNNPQQKIKYVEVLKQENAELIQKVRELQSKLTKKQFKRGDDSTRKDGRGSSASGSEPLDEYPSMESGDDHSDDGSYEERTKLLKKMWARNKKLEEEIDRLQKEKQALVMRQSRSPSVDSRQSKQSSTRSITRSTARSTTPSTPQSSTTSSRWRK